MASSTIPAGGAGGGLQPKYQKFTSSGTFTLPDGYGAAKPLLITMQVIGGGGGGAGVITFTNNGNGYLGRNSYFGAGAHTYAAGSYVVAGRGGSSGGLAATQLYLTANLTITVGAAGAAGAAKTWTENASYNNGNGWNQGNYANNQNASTNANAFGGTGGTTTAGSVSSTGGAGGNALNTWSNNNVAKIFWGNNAEPKWMDNTETYGVYANTGSYGAAGNPAGTVGDAVPLLGTLAGGSTNTTPVYGSFGIGGKFGDGATSTGVEGTGGGGASVGAPGAVIITYWA